MLPGAWSEWSIPDSSERNQAQDSIFIMKMAVKLLMSAFSDKLNILISYSDILKSTEKLICCPVLLFYSKTSLLLRPILNYDLAEGPIQHSLRSFLLLRLRCPFWYAALKKEAHFRELLF